MAKKEQPAELKFYSREDSEEFKAIIEHKLEDANAELEMMQRQIERSEVDKLNVTEFSSDMADNQNMERLMARQRKFIDSLERALVRIREGRYGRCKVTGKLIPKERLRAVPHTEVTIEAKLKQ